MNSARMEWIEARSGVVEIGGTSFSSKPVRVALSSPVRSAIRDKILVIVPAPKPAAKAAAKKAAKTEG